MKVLCMYIGQQQPNDIIEVDESRVEALLKRGDYIVLDKMPEPVKVLGANEEARVDEFAQDLKDDAKRNYSNRKKNNA